MSVMKTLQEIEREVILERLQQCNGNKTRTAETLGISLKTLYNRLNEYGVAMDERFKRNRK